MPSGTLILMFQNSSAGCKTYKCHSERSIAIDYWKRIYGPAFKKCEVIDHINVVEGRDSSIQKKSVPEYGSIKGNGGKITKSHIKTKVL